MKPKLDEIRKILANLRRAGNGAGVFGAGSHGFRLNPLVASQDLRAFEQKHAVRLPGDYREFLLNVGNGGAGPFYGLFPLGRHDSDCGEGFVDQVEGDGMTGVLRQPFPHVEAWQPPPHPEVGDDEDAAMEAYDAIVYAPELVNGAVPICHAGCALRYWLVVTGPLAGDVWYDRRTEGGGLEPVRLAGGRRAGFLDWYGRWLDDALRGGRGGVK